MEKNPGIKLRHYHPSGGIAGVPVLIYTLPFLVNPGDVGLLESGAQISDLIRFYNAPGANHTLLIFYSDADGTDLADVGIPASPGAYLINETDVAGQNGAVWKPGIGQPGLGGPLPAWGSWSYTIVSDVPEPGSVTLFLGGTGLWLWRCRRRRT